MKAISFSVVLKIASAVKHICISIHIFPALLNVTASSTESVTTCICRQDCVAVFQEEQSWAHLYHVSQWELDVVLPADGTFSQSREQTPGYHFRSSIYTWPIRVRPSQETPMGWSHTHLRRKISCAVLRENHCCLFMRTARAITIWNRELDSVSLCHMPDLFSFFGKATQIWPSNKCL